MKVPRLTTSWVLSMLASTCSYAQSNGPDDRGITDPGSVTSTPIPGARAIPFDDLYRTRSLSGAAWSPNGKEILFTANMTGRSNLWKVDAAGGWPVQLTQSEERQTFATWSPDGKWIVFQQDSGGDELWDIFAVPSGGGEVVNLTNTPDVREMAPLWSPDGKTIALEYRPKQASVDDLALLDWTSHKVNKLTHETSSDYSWTPVAWSPDARTLYAFRSDIGGTDADVFAVDIRSGQTRNLTAHQGKVRNIASSLSPDGKTLLINSDAKSGYQNLGLLDIATRRIRWVTDTKWKVSAGDFSPTGKAFTYILDADGLIDVYLVDASNLHARKLPLANGVNTLTSNLNSFSPSGDRLLLSHESSVQPGDFWVYNIASRSKQQLSRSAIASLNSAPMPESQIVHYRSFDGKVISALMWVPFNLKRDGSNPAVVWPHGGPAAQLQDTWNPRVAALVSRGYICIAPNARGSTGYGADFQHANFQDLGGGDLQDEVYATKFLQATGYVAPSRIGISGGSYGGFMTLMAIGKTPGVWAAAADWYGIIDWATMVQQSDPLLQQLVKSLLGDPIKDRKNYDAASPITYIHKVTAPLLVLQGDNDPRVPKEQAMQVVDLLKKDGKTVDAHYYPNEGHNFRRTENQIDAIRRTVDWFDKYLMNKQ
jgi:dipeptidyl aminopeptidase/acylaminoacyl peptidase